MGAELPIGSTAPPNPHRRSCRCSVLPRAPPSFDRTPAVAAELHRPALRRDTGMEAAAAEAAAEAMGTVQIAAHLRPDSFGRFGKFGGKYVPETLMHALSELEAAFHSVVKDQGFQVESPCPPSSLRLHSGAHENAGLSLIGRAQFLAAYCYPLSFRLISD